jgi:flagellar basal-body rod protein FlgB
VDSFAADVIMKAMSGLSERMAVTADNIANVSTPNYRPLRVSFEAALAEAARRGAEAVRSMKPIISRATSDAGEDGLRVDLELARASQTAGRYSALAELLDRQLQIEGLAIKGSS